MEYSRGNYFCSSPHSDPTQYYDCMHMVGWEKYAVEIRSTADCVLANHYPEWDRVLTENLVLIPPDAESAKRYVERGYVKTIDEANTLMARRVHYPVLRDNVVAWLNKNVAPSTDIQRISMTNGWVVYSDEAMIKNSTSSFSIFFLRRRDALKFIKVWSTLGKPTQMFKQ